MTPRALLPLLPLGLLVLGSAGCAHGAFSMGNMTPDPSFSVRPPAPADLITADGGIRTSGSSIYSGRRAVRIGDHLTVRIAHNTRADSNANTKLGRTSSAEVGLGAMLGLETQLEKIGLTPGASIAGDATATFDGNGGTTRTGALTGTLTVQVVDVLPNGHLVVGGRQALKINNEVQVLSLRGIVDPRAVDADNSVASSQIVDARVEFSGVGVVAGKQRPGWLARILDVITPF
jgi:flagellar L-ring protein precursor FlgH